MKIAIPTTDGIRINSSIQKIKGFVIFEISKGKVVKETFVARNNDAVNGMNGDGEKEDPVINNETEKTFILPEISDCQLVIANGFGKMMFEALVKDNKEVFITEAGSVRNAINHFIRQTLKNHPEMA